MIKVNVKAIGPQGLMVNDAIPVEEFGFTADDYLRFIKPLKVTAKISKYADTLLADIIVKTRYDSFCSRSLEKVERDWEDHFTLDFPIESTTEFVEIGEEIRQEVLTRLPVRVLSDQEQEKERQEIEREKRTEPKDTYQPFADLKLSEEDTEVDETE